MYKTILVTLDGTPTDRAIIEHVKQLAKLAHSRVVLLHVADGWAAQNLRPGRGQPGDRPKTPPIWKESGPSSKPRAFPAEAELAYGDPVDGNRQMGPGEGLRPGGDEHARAPVPGRPVPRHHRQPGPAQHQRARAASQGEMKRATKIR